MTHDDEATQRRIGELIRRRREESRQSATGFARTAGINFRTLKSLETGERRPWDATGEKIERALGWKPGSLDLLSENPDALIAAEENPDSLLAATAGEVARIDERFHGAAERLRDANVGVAAERLAQLPAEDIARVQDLIDELGRARYPDWDDGDDYALAWNRRAKLVPLSAADEQAVLDSLDDTD